MSSTTERDVAARDHIAIQVHTDWAGALRSARGVTISWYRTQALAHVGRYAPKEEAEAILHEALAAAAIEDEPFKRITVSAWPLRAFVETGNAGLLPAVLAGLVRDSADIEPRSSRSEALFLLFQAVALAEKAIWRPVFNAFVEASIPVEHWRQRRNLRDALAIIREEDPELVEQTVARVEDPRTQGVIQRRLAHPEPGYIRPFFWRR